MLSDICLAAFVTMPVHSPSKPPTIEGWERPGSSGAHNTRERSEVTADDGRASLESRYEVKKKKREGRRIGWDVQLSPSSFA